MYKEFLKANLCGANLFLGIGIDGDVCLHNSDLKGIK